MRPGLDFCLDKNHENLPFYRYGLMFFGSVGKPSVTRSILLL